MCYLMDTYHELIVIYKTLYTFQFPEGTPNGQIGGNALQLVDEAHKQDQDRAQTPHLNTGDKLAWSRAWDQPQKATHVT